MVWCDLLGSNSVVTGEAAKRILLGMPTQYLCTTIHHQCFVMKILLARFKPVIEQTASSAQNTSRHQLDLDPNIECNNQKS
jgi:hypothetical protein